LFPRWSPFDTFLIRMNGQQEVKECRGRPENFRPIFPGRFSEHLDERAPDAYPEILI